MIKSKKVVSTKTWDQKYLEQLPQEVQRETAGTSAFMAKMNALEWLRVKIQESSQVPSPKHEWAEWTYVCIFRIMKLNDIKTNTSWKTNMTNNIQTKYALAMQSWTKQSFEYD